MYLNDLFDCNLFPNLKAFERHLANWWLARGTIV
jgi:hypothetical protein